MSLRICNFTNTDLDFKYMFYGNEMSCQKEPMFKWLVDTRKVLTVNSADKDWGYIKNKRREKSWISESYAYWSSPARYFVIGYAIERCKVQGSGLAISLNEMVNIFSDKELHKALIADFVNDFFYNSSVDMYSTKACKNKSLIEYRALKSCFEIGYRLCSDIYLAFDQAKNMGPIGSFMHLSKICIALGFDELPLWYIQESSEHGLNTEISKDVGNQRGLASWAFVRNDNHIMMVAQSDPYGMKGHNDAYIPSRSNNDGIVPLSTGLGVKTQLPRVKSEKAEKSVGVNADKKVVKSAAVDAFFDNGNSLVDTEKTAFSTNPMDMDIGLDIPQDTDVDSLDEVSVELTEQEKAIEAKKEARAARLLGLF